MGETLAKSSDGATEPRAIQQLKRSAGVCRDIAASELSAAGRALLAHKESMTARLEQFHGGRVALEALSSRREGDWLARQVLLRLEKNGRPVEYGAIRVCLPALPEPVRAEVLRGETPLGRLLAEHRFDADIRPLAFLSVEPNAWLAELFGLGEPPYPILEGRRARIREAKTGNLAAEIVEVLPLSLELPGVDRS
jgi:chorismate-pyruvate lyase